MRYFKKILAFWLLVSIQSICNGQGVEVEVYKVPEGNHNFKFEIRPSANMQLILDSVLPGVRFVLVGSTESSFKKLIFISDSDTSYIYYSSLQLYLGLKKDSIFHFSDEAVMKTFIYFDHILMQGTNYYGNDLNPDNIVILPCYIKYQGSKHQMETMESQRINYKADVKLLQNNNYLLETSSGIFRPASLQYLFQVDDKFVTYYKRISSDSIGNVDSSRLIQFNAPYNYRYRKSIYNEIRNKSTNDQSQ